MKKDNKFIFKIYAGDFSEFINSILKYSKKNYFAINADCINIAIQDNEYYQLLSDKDSLVYLDGMGAVYAARLKGFSIPERLATTDLIIRLLESNEHLTVHPKIFFLGGKPGVAKKAQKLLLSLYPKANFIGAHHGYFDNDKQIIDIINKLNPDILFVGFGCPKQEKWSYLNRRKIKARVLITCGGMFDYYSGSNIKRAPVWMQRIGAEWIFRLVLEPKRLWKRYILGNFKYLLNLRKINFEINKNG